MRAPWIAAAGGSARCKRRTSHAAATLAPLDQLAEQLGRV
jgi:hypothetical protein